MLRSRDEGGKQVFPTGGTRVLAYPAAHYAVADGKGDYAFMLHQRAHGRGPQRGGEEERAGDTLLADGEGALAPRVRARSLIGITVQIDESPGQVYDAKHSTLHPLFNK